MLLGKHESSGRIKTEFRYQENGDLKELIERKQVDVLLSTAEGGIGDPMPTALLSSELGIPEQELYRWATRISVDPKLTLAALRSRVPTSTLKGVVLIPFERAESYRILVRPEHRGTPYRDFFYNVTYEAITYACRYWGASRLALNQLYFCQQPFHMEVALCQCEALIHEVDENSAAIVQSLCFLGCRHVPANTFQDFGPRLSGVESKHRSIERKMVELRGGFGHVITLNWSS